MTRHHVPASAIDPLDHPDVARAGEAAATETLVRAYVRDLAIPVPAPGEELVLDFPAAGVRLRVPVRHRSATGWHRFGEPYLAGDGPEVAAGVALVAAVVVRETAVRAGLPAHRVSDATSRVLDSARRVTAHLACRRAEGPPPGTGPGAKTSTATDAFLRAEQALLLGHPFHPAPKSREEASAGELAAYSPELRGSFPLHWFAAAPGVVTGESADGRDPAELCRRIAPAGLDLPDGWTPVPAHPWQAREVVRRPAVAALLEAGLLRPLGPAGPAWHPTSSVRTVYRAEAEVMLKLSLGMRITNSRRENLRGELRLGVRAARLLAAGPAAWLRAEHPAFGILRDFAWVAVDDPATRGGAETGFETAIRDNPFRNASDGALCVAGLLAERTGPGDGSPPRHRALLASAVERAARAFGRSVAEASALWLGRYLDVLAVPLIRLQARYGVALEPHHQNTLVALGADGLPRAGWYRDSQGYYLAASRAGELERLVPGLTDGVDLVFDDAFVDERVAYYLGIGNLLGLVGAFGALGLAAEEDLLRVLRAALERLRAAEPGAKGLLGLLLDAPVLRCKGNHLTCVDGRDELAGDVHSQSVYIDLPNPLPEVQR
ncbi:IucA/IucC family protein [Nonomuraea roseoviolacea]|uniref:Siderophore synthetase component n=1 Tax=Nonomuraea roseoviolacea subsp. carminata TaxID=160689 RepID=A0ABT1KAP6_9ACTN|nr:IucA/IucC family protein [Nonomuraea roseoviolacea]MCP2351093.1 siderophore synthetase component [Nonomuraea roseoviolacea subsp. carminata]